MPILKASKPSRAAKKHQKKAGRPAPKANSHPLLGTKSPDRPYAGMVCCQLGALFPGTGFFFPEGYQFLTGLVIYHSIGSVYCRIRGVKPCSGIEFVDEVPLSCGSWILVKSEDYDAQKEKKIPVAALRREPGMEGFPQN